MDLIRALGYQALDSRIKRISDRFVHDVKALYRQRGVAMEPNWYLIFQILEREKCTNMAYIISQTKYAQPTIVTIVKKMIANGYVQSKVDPKDKRIQWLSLTKKAHQELPFFRKIWDSCSAAFLDLLDGDLQLLSQLDKIDDALDAQSFKERFASQLDDFLTQPSNE